MIRRADRLFIEYHEDSLTPYGYDIDTNRVA